MSEKPVVEKAQTNEEQIFENLRHRLAWKPEGFRFGFKRPEVGLMAVSSREPIANTIEHCFSLLSKGKWGETGLTFRLSPLPHGPPPSSHASKLESVRISRRFALRMTYGKRFGFRPSLAIAQLRQRAKCRRAGLISRRGFGKQILKRRQSLKQSIGQISRAFRAFQGVRNCERQIDKNLLRFV
jgi:hypothetical protein